MIDTHAHLMFSQFEGEIDKVIERAFEAGVEKIINIGCNVESSCRALEMAYGKDCLYAALGIHPYDAAECSDELMKEWEDLVNKDRERGDDRNGGRKIVAIGECGLDYFKAEVPKELQRDAFRRQLELASRLDLPVIIHNRDADEECLEILGEFDGSSFSGVDSSRVDAVFHCYGSDLEFAQKVWERGYFTSLTGIITYSKAENLREVVCAMPLDKFMVETDCPYLAPQKYRGERNEPAYVVEVIEKIAELRGMSFEEVAEISTKNAKKFFGI